MTFAAEDAFRARFRPHGLRADALWGCYAMAETTFALTHGAGDDPLRLDPVGPDAAHGLGLATPVVSVGRPLPGVELDVLGADGEPLPDGVVGELRVRAPFLADGYAGAGAPVGGFAADGYRTGDLGYVRDGRVFVCGRASDVIIVGGINVFPQDVEELVGAVPGVKAGRVVAFGVDDARQGTQRLVVLCEPARDALDDDALAGGAPPRRGALGVGNVAVHAVPAGSLVKSSSGKLARAENRRRHLARGSGRRPPLKAHGRGADTERSMTVRAESDMRLLVEQQAAAYAAEHHVPPPFDPSRPVVPVSGRVFGPEEVVAAVGASLDFWLTAGPQGEAFERELAQRTGNRHALMVNSGSSANLAAVFALTSPLLGERRLRPGDEVLTVAAGFPTTVNPIIQAGLVPVFVDVTLPTYEVDVRELEAAVSPRTRAVVIAHTLGNAFDLDAVTALCKRHDLLLVEDCCDALGATWHGQPVGTFGEFATLSFYPAHQITMGEGGAVICNKGAHKVVAESFRDWGRDCWCSPGKEDTCGKRFDVQNGLTFPRATTTSTSTRTSAST